MPGTARLRAGGERGRQASCTPALRRAGQGSRINPGNMVQYSDVTIRFFREGLTSVLISESVRSYRKEVLV